MNETEGRRAARLATVAFAGLAVAALAAFLLSSILKSQASVLAGIERVKYFSPNGDGERDVQVVSFTMDEADDINVDVVDVDSTRIRRVISGKAVKKGDRVTLRWDGRDDDGKIAPDGEYSIRVTLRHEGRSILAPRPFQLDTKPPDPVVVVEPDNAVVTPGSQVAFSVRRTGEIVAPSFEVLRTDLPEPQTVRELPGQVGLNQYTWDGNDDSGQPVPPGTYLIRVRAQDAAGNVAELPALPLDPRQIRGRPGVTVRDLAVQPPATPARSGAMALFRVDARRRAFSWKLRRVGDPKVLRKGSKAAGKTSFEIKLPYGPSGMYVVEVTAHGAVSRVPLAVQARAHKPLLVVVPMMTWLGRDPVDSNFDGVPDTFDTARHVPYPRLFGYPGGLPTGIARDVGPLLAFMDEAGYHYDLTTDLALSRDEEPAEDRPGVLFLGSPEWVSPDVAEHLRTYVKGGGRLALFAPRSLRATVKIQDRRLTDPTPAAPEDALDGRIGDVRALSNPLVVFKEDDSLGLLEGFAGELTGFTQVEELLDPGPDAEVATAVGEETTDLRPAFSASTDGDGVIIRVGLPEWVSKLADEDPNVQQLTYNIIDVLRDARPHARGAN